jgi:hypothetical protein
MKKLSLLIYISLTVLKAIAVTSDSTSIFKPSLFVNAGLSLTTFNQSVLETRANPFIDVEFQVSPALSPVFHYNRINGYNIKAYYPRIIRQSMSPSSVNQADTIYNVSETERLNMNVYSLKFKFKLLGTQKSYAYISPQMGFTFAKNKRERQGSNYYDLTKSTEMFYSYGADLGLDQQLSTDGKLRLTLGATILMGNTEEKDFYNYSSRLSSRLVTYQLSAGLKFFIYQANAI